MPILRALQLLLRFFFGSVSPPPVPAALLALALPAPPTPLVPLAPLLPSDAADEVAIAHLRRDVVERGGGERVEVLLGEDEGGAVPVRARDVREVQGLHMRAGTRAGAAGVLGSLGGRAGRRGLGIGQRFVRPLELVLVVLEKAGDGGSSTASCARVVSSPRLAVARTSQQQLLAQLDDAAPARPHWVKTPFFGYK